MGRCMVDTLQWTPDQSILWAHKLKLKLSEPGGSQEEAAGAARAYAVGEGGHPGQRNTAHPGRVGDGVPECQKPRGAPCRTRTKPEIFSSIHRRNPHENTPDRHTRRSRGHQNTGQRVVWDRRW